MMTNNPFAHLDPNSPFKKHEWEDARPRLERLFEDLNQAAFGGECQLVHDEDTGRLLLTPNIGIALIKDITELSVHNDFREDSFRAGASLCVCPAPSDGFFRFVLTTWRVARIWNIPNRIYVGTQFGPHQTYFEVRTNYEDEIINKLSKLAQTMMDHLRANDCI